jgi:TolB-like protein/predicted Ser/Thr protein kinase
MPDHDVSMTAPAPKLLRRLGRYQNLSLLGQGGMGSVYQALDPVLDRRVAIKVMNDRTPDFVSRFHREAKVMARLSHPNVVQIYDFDQDEEGNPYFVMELVSGRSLKTVVEEQGRLEPSFVIDILRQAAAGLGAAHALGIVHRDIKPANLVLTHGGGLKVLDFGIARVEASTEGGDPALTRPQALLGTPLYMAPEMLQGQAVDGRADIYALGLMAFHLLAGKPPFEAPTVVELMMKHLNTPLPDLTQVAPGTPPGLVQLIRRMTEKDREQRTAHCEVLLGELATIEVTTKLAAQAPTPIPAAPVTAPTAPQPAMPALAQSLPPAEAPASAPVATPGSGHDAGGARRRLIAGVLGGLGALVATLLILSLGSRLHRRPTQGQGITTAPPAGRPDPSVSSQPSSSLAPAALVPPEKGEKADKDRVTAAPLPLGQQGPLRLAVLQFKNLGGDRDLDFLTEGIGDTVLTALGTLHGRIRLIERGQIEQAIQEIDFGQTKYVDKTTAVTLGKLTGAELAVLGGYQRSEGLIRVSARLIRTDTGDVLDTLLVTRPAKALFDVQDEVAAELKRRLLTLISSGK